MLHFLRIAMEAIAALGAVCGCVYSLLGWWAARDFLRSRPAPSDFAPPVTILKPLKGADPGMYDSFRSHCLQDYPEYELIFGVDNAEDAAAAEVRRLQQEFPQRAIRLVVCEQLLGANVKVSNLAQMLPHARYPHLLVNDSDIRVEPDYLRSVMRHFADPQVGMVTCLYRGVGGGSLGATLEALGISTDFAAGVLTARWLEGIRFGLGSTLAFSRAALQAIGGFEPLLDYLADDYELGARIAQSGRGVVLADAVVEHRLPPYTMDGFVAHQLRWNRAIRDSRPRGYAGLALTFALPWAMLALLLSWGATWAWVVLADAAVMRLLVSWTVGRSVLRDRHLARSLWLLPLRDAVAMALWAGGFAGQRIVWRGRQFLLQNGKLRPI
ncbi:MAG TPA: bacteriohopanetetrol glucosamine biosynthesis glycosyltransferase HpnI [Terriglobales bacterium]|nr:bacteriohopanetetrol glucosamine biosynthesis glycosyltransferase HpnI [Terriglobales bacterium]